VPGPLFGDGDWLAFAEIDHALFETEFNEADPRALAEELQQRLDEQADPQSIVQHMVRRLPSLEKCRPALVNGVQRGLRMLTTLLVARSRDQPVTMPRSFTQA